MLHIVLYEPEIPGNTGNAIRLSANTGATLHLVGRLGFDMDDAKLRRAGLDYHEYAAVRRHDDLDACLADVAPGRVFAFTAHASRRYDDVAYRTGDVLLFGPEAKGLPPAALERFGDEERLRIPMRPDNRSLNLSNAVAVAVYEAWRQLGFPGAS